MMVDGAYVKVHQHGAGTAVGNWAIGRTKEGLNTKLHLAVDAHGMPVRMRVTARTLADCTQAVALIDGIPLDAVAEYLLADRGYDTNKALAATRERGLTPVLPPQRSRKGRGSMISTVPGATSGGEWFRQAVRNGAV